MVTLLDTSTLRFDRATLELVLLRRKTAEVAFPAFLLIYMTCIQNPESLFVSSGKMASEGEAHTGPPTATTAGIRSIRERGSH